ncbi:MAG: hypothetical protein WC705_02595 [Candidatus Paceibacterota bacterium]|jgi:hypothetical protein
MNYFRGNKKTLIKSLLMLVLVVTLFGFFNQEAQAGILSSFIDFSGSVLIKIILFVFGLIQWLVGVVFIKFGAMLVNFAMYINKGLLTDLNDTHFVIIGWKVFRDLANLGFTLGIIIIAVSIILRFKSYGSQKVLTNLIVAALLINFSLVIAGSIIKTSDVFSNFFLKYIDASGTSNWSARITGMFRMQGVVISKDPSARPVCDAENDEKIKEACEQQKKDGTITDVDACIKNVTDSMCKFDSVIPDNTDLANIKEDSALSASFYTLAGLLISIVVGVFIGLTLLALAFMLLLRYFNLAFLLMVSPLVWVLWVFPYTKQYWKKWWDSFIKWVLFAPITLFFVYLTLIFLSKSSGGFGGQANEVATGSGTSIAGIGFADMMIPFMAGALLLAGLKISQTMGFAGAGFVLKQSSKLQNWAKTKARRGAARAGRRALGERTRNVANKIGSSKWANRLTLGGASKLAEVTTKGRATLEKKSQEFIDEKVKHYETIKDSKQLAALLPTMNKEERMAALEVLSKRGDMKETQGLLGMDQVIESVETANTIGRGKSASDTQKSFGMSLNMMKAMKSSDGKHEGKTYEEHAKEFYGNFSSDDWKKSGAAIGNHIFKPVDPTTKEVVDMPGMTKEQSNKFREQYVAGLTGGFGEGISAIAPKLKGESTKKMLEDVVASVAGDAEVVSIKDAIEKASKDMDGDKVIELVRQRDEEGVKEIKITASRDDILRAIREGDLDKAVNLMKNSKNPKLITIASKINKSMGAAILSASGEEGKSEEKKPEEKKPEEPKK